MGRSAAGSDCGRADRVAEALGAQGPAVIGQLRRRSLETAVGDEIAALPQPGHLRRRGGIDAAQNAACKKVGRGDHRPARLETAGLPRVLRVEPAHAGVAAFRRLDRVNRGARDDASLAGARQARRQGAGDRRVASWEGVDRRVDLRKKIDARIGGYFGRGRAERREAVGVKQAEEFVVDMLAPQEFVQGELVQRKRRRRRLPDRNLGKVRALAEAAQKRL